MAVLHARLSAVSDHGRCFTLERLKSATSQTLGNRSSDSSQSTGSAVFSGELHSLPPHHYMLSRHGGPSQQAWGWLESFEARSIAERKGWHFWGIIWETPESSNITFAHVYWYGLMG